MNWILGPVLKYIAAGLLVALLLALAALKIQSNRLETRTDERDLAQREANQLRAAVSGKDDTIAALQSANEQWRALSIPADAMNQAAERTEKAAKLIEDRTRALTPSEVRDHANPDCAALLALDIARSCPGHAFSVRQRARGGLSGPAGGSPEAGGAARP